MKASATINAALDTPGIQNDPKDAVIIEYAIAASGNDVVRSVGTSTGAGRLDEENQRGENKVRYLNK